MIKLMVYLKDYKKECLLGPMFKFLEVIFELLLPTMLAVMINKGVAYHNIPFVFQIGGVMVMMAIVGYGSALICQRFASRASQGFGTVLRNVVFKKVMGFSYAQMDKFGASTLTTRLTNDINQLQVMVAMAIRLMVRAPFICIGAIIMSFFLDVKMALLLLAATPVLALIIFGITRCASPLYRNYQKLLDRLTDVLRENLSGVRVVRSFGKTTKEQERFEAANGELTGTGLHIGALSALFNPLTSLVINFVILLILWVGGFRIDTGHLLQGQVIAFINYVTQILYAVFVMSNLIILLTKSMAAAARVNEVLDTDVTADSRINEAEEVKKPQEIRFQEVSFRYHKSRDTVLDHLSFSVTQGETIGIIGGTGSGKSTVVNLLAGFYTPDSGSILLDECELKNLPTDIVRKKIAVVPQKAILFTGTIADNIRFGRENASMEEVMEAARTAQADEFVMNFAEKYDTMVERGGANLSGGQKQRLTIARALLMRPDILILDDASSALDFLTDANLRKAIRESSKDMTVFLVSQRVGVIKNADRILVLEDGKAAGYGKHADLFETCTVYRQICLSQLSEEEAAS